MQRREGEEAGIHCKVTAQEGIHHVDGRIRNSGEGQSDIEQGVAEGNRGCYNVKSNVCINEGRDVEGKASSAREEILGT